MRSILLLLSFLVSLVGFGQVLFVGDQHTTTSGITYSVQNSGLNTIAVEANGFATIGLGQSATRKYGILVSYSPLTVGQTTTFPSGVIACSENITTGNMSSGGVQFTLTELGNENFVAPKGTTTRNSTGYNDLIATSVIYMYRYRRWSTSTSTTANPTYDILPDPIIIQLPPESINFNGNSEFANKICEVSYTEFFGFPKTYVWNSNVVTCRMFRTDILAPFNEFELDGSEFLSSDINSTFLQVVHLVNDNLAPLTLNGNMYSKISSLDNFTLTATGEWVNPVFQSNSNETEFLHLLNINVPYDISFPLTSNADVNDFFIYQADTTTVESANLPAVEEGILNIPVSNFIYSLPTIDFPNINSYNHYYCSMANKCGVIYDSPFKSIFRLPTPDNTGYNNQIVCSNIQINQLANPGTVTIGSRSYSWAFFPTATETTPFIGTDIAQSTTYYVRYKLVENGNTYYSDTYTTVSVTVLDPTVGAISGTQSICQGNTPSVISSSTNGSSTSGIVSYEWQLNASGSYATISGATDATYQPGALTATTSYQRRTVSTSGSTSCYSAYTTPITITVNSSVLAGTVSGSQTICSGSSATGVHVSGHQGSIQWQSSTDNINFTNITGQTEPTLSTGSLSTTTYYRAVVTFSGCSGYSTTGIVNVLSSGSWLGASGVTITPAMYNNASNWCGGVVPTSPTIPPGVTVYMDGSYDFTNVTIECGGSLIITSTGRVNITNVLTNNGLVHVINGGTIHYGTTSVGECPGTYEITQNFAPSRYWYVGPTTTNTVRTDFGSVASTNNQTGTQMWSWNEATNATNGYISPLYNAGTTTLIPGKGYVYRNLGATTLDVNVTGPYITTPISHTGLTRTGTGVLAGYHLFSNPYTAYLDADDLFNNNSGTTNLVSSIWVRSNSTANGGAATMVFDTYNASSGIGTGLGWQTAALNGNPGGISNLMRWIAPMQGFWVRVNTTGSGSLAYNYNMAEANPVGAGQLRTTSPISGLARLNVNFGDQKDQMVAALSANATNGFEAFDSEKMFTSGVVQVYAPNSGKKLAINTLKNNKSKVSMPLTVECPGAGWYSFDLVELILENGVVFLEDKLNGEMKDLTIDSSYQFYANSGVLQNRFILHFHLPSAISNVTGPTAIEDLVSESQSATIDITSTGSGKVTVALDQVDEVTNSAVRICDLNGRVVDSFMADGKSFEFQINQGQGAYLIEVTNGLTVEKKKVFIQ